MDFRVEVVDGFGNKSYITRSGGAVQYFSSAEIPLALSNISDNAAMLRFHLRDSVIIGDVEKALNLYTCRIKSWRFLK